MKYYYISAWTPIGFTAIYYRGEKHPLDPKTYQQRREALSRQIQLGTSTMVPAESIIYISLCKLPAGVAKEQWPEDFIGH